MFLIPFLVQIINQQLCVPLIDVELDLRAWAWEGVVLILLLYGVDMADTDECRVDEVKSSLQCHSVLLGLKCEMHSNFYLSQILMFLDTPQAQHQQVCQWLVLLLIRGACWPCDHTTPPVLRTEKGTAEPTHKLRQRFVVWKTLWVENSLPSAKKLGNEADKLQGCVVRNYCTETLLFVRGESNLFFSYR